MPWARGNAAGLPWVKYPPETVRAEAFGVLALLSVDAGGGAHCGLPPFRIVSAALKIRAALRSLTLPSPSHARR